MAQWEVVRHGMSLFFARRGEPVSLTLNWPGGTRSAEIDLEDLRSVAVGIPFALLLDGIGLVIHPIAGWIVFDLEDPLHGDRVAMVRASEYWTALRTLDRA